MNTGMGKFAIVKGNLDRVAHVRSRLNEGVAFGKSI
jgi:hypothetical protein